MWMTSYTFGDSSFQKSFDFFAALEQRLSRQVCPPSVFFSNDPSLFMSLVKEFFNRLVPDQSISQGSYLARCPTIPPPWSIHRLISPNVTGRLVIIWSLLATLIDGDPIH